MQRRGGHMDSGKRVHVYAADMRRSVALQFWPDGYEWAEKEPVTLAEGFSGHAAGVDTRQALPQSFRVRHGQAAQGIFLAREITNAWALEQKVSPPALDYCNGIDTRSQHELTIHQMDCRVQQQRDIVTLQEVEGDEKEADPGAAVALGAALLVRLLVPAWVVNATPLPISAVVLPRVKPPPKAPPPQVIAEGSNET